MSPATSSSEYSSTRPTSGTAKPFLLAPWQEEALTEIFGHVDDDGNRVIKMAYFEVPKKAGQDGMGRRPRVCSCSSLTRIRDARCTAQPRPRGRR